MDLPARIHQGSLLTEIRDIMRDSRSSLGQRLDSISDLSSQKTGIFESTSARIESKMDELRAQISASGGASSAATTTTSCPAVPGAPGNSTLF